MVWRSYSTAALYLVMGRLFYLSVPSAEGAQWMCPKDWFMLPNTNTNACYHLTTDLTLGNRSESICEDNWNTYKTGLAHITSIKTNAGICAHLTGTDAPYMIGVNYTKGAWRYVKNNQEVNLNVFEIITSNYYGTGTTCVVMDQDCKWYVRSCRNVTTAVCEIADVNQCIDNIGCPADAEQCVPIGPRKAICKCGHGRLHNKLNNTCDDIDECSLDKTLCNTTSMVCENTFGSYNCECKVGYLKNDGICQVPNKLTEPSSSLMLHIIIILVIVGVVLLLAVGAVVAYVYYELYKKLQEKSLSATMSPTEEVQMDEEEEGAEDDNKEDVDEEDGTIKEATSLEIQQDLVRMMVAEGNTNMMSDVDTGKVTFL